MATLYQRAADGRAIPGDDVTHAAYGPIPAAELFQGPDGQYQRPEIVHGWQYSHTFGRWSALVTFPCGWRGFSWPVSGRAKG